MSKQKVKNILLLNANPLIKPLNKEELKGFDALKVQIGIELSDLIIDTDDSAEMVLYDIIHKLILKSNTRRFMSDIQCRVIGGTNSNSDSVYDGTIWMEVTANLSKC